ncbi:hypothetical protein ACFXDO_14560, partial [Streptomyces nigra]
MTAIEVIQLLISPIHRYVGQPADGPVPTQEDELIDSVEVRRALRAVPSFPVDRRAASDAVHRKAEGRPHTGCMRTIRQ